MTGLWRLVTSRPHVPAHSGDVRPRHSVRVAVAQARTPPAAICAFQSAQLRQVCQGSCSPSPGASQQIILLYATRDLLRVCLRAWSRSSISCSSIWASMRGRTARMAVRRRFLGDQRRLVSAGGQGVECLGLVRRGRGGTNGLSEVRQPPVESIGLAFQWPWQSPVPDGGWPPQATTSCQAANNGNPGRPWQQQGLGILASRTPTSSWTSLARTRQHPRWALATSMESVPVPFPSL